MVTEKRWPDGNRKEVEPDGNRKEVEPDDDRCAVMDYLGR
jgi:hypothetical protein